jgi:hypothetical protein
MYYLITHGLLSVREKPLCFRRVMVRRSGFTGELPPLRGSIPLFFAAGPPVQIVAVASSPLVLVVLWPLEAPVMSIRKLGLGEHCAAALTAVHSDLPIPDEFATAICTVGYHYPDFQWVSCAYLLIWVMEGEFWPISGFVWGRTI